ncbi:MAG: protein-disulfide reductase DsbD [Gallionella sp.]
MRFVLLLLICFLSTSSNAEGILDRMPGSVVAKQTSFLTPDQAFGFDADVRDIHTLQASFNVSPGYYLYRDKIKFSIKEGTVKVTALALPQGEIKHDPNFGDTRVFHHSFQALVRLNRPANAATDITLNAVYQGCSEQGLCYPPITKTMNISLPDAGNGQPAPPIMTEAAPPTIEAPTTEGSRIARLFKGGNYWLIMSFFFGAGMLLSLTPCVFPMIPILSGIIAGRGHNTRIHAFVLSLVYVMGMALAYAAAGIAAGFSGNLISDALQTPWVLGSFAALFVLLSLSMFGLYELQFPTALQSKLSDTSNRQHSGHLGVFFMGALSALIVGPCVAAPLAGALLYIGQTHDAVLGGVALFVMALGMGVPLLLIGTSAGLLLPKAGAWMQAVKQFFGVMLLALAIWIIQPVLPINVQMFLWALLLILSAAFFLVLDTSPHNTSKWHKFIKGAGLSAGALLGIAYLVGAVSGARDVLRPLGNIGRTEATAPATLQFSRIKDIADLDQRLAQAHGQPVMLDFYADWCVSCKEMNRYTFSDANVQAKLKHVLLLQADVTANSETDKDLLKRYGMYGPPGILFFDKQGKEMSDYRVIGYQDPGQFLQTTENSCQFTNIC